MALELGEAIIHKDSHEIFGPYSVSYRHLDGKGATDIYGLSKERAEEIVREINHVNSKE